MRTNVLYYQKCRCELDHTTFTWRKRSLIIIIPSQQKVPKLFGYVLVNQEPNYKRSLKNRLLDMVLLDVSKQDINTKLV